ncbi:hypothetical protein N7508_008868 [Penicillium antarcticum]|uniref:uncharacterized protein n=1 Tax=Penicillium antarcticum TaxID=416450 RepID=UPI002398B7D1|nr:uncharacterized protein N7508_008868 [Penicillium antarcticum]KAJ5294047.1 hypothetical protein N7508_008868 [Penicillium antarcticum]
MAAHHRKVELQSPADFTYLYANTIALARRKLDLNLPPSAIDNETPDPMRERVRELVDDYINKTFETASSSISINGLDSTSEQFPFPAALTTPMETIEYEAYDTELASRVTALYAQLESLTTGIAQQRRDAPRRAAKEYAAQLKALIQGEVEEEYVSSNSAGMTSVPEDGMDVDSAPKEGADRAWKLETALGTAEEQERWASGDIAGVYEDALRTILRLQGEGEGEGVQAGDGAEGHALATTVGKAERAGRAAEVVENM